MLIESNGDFYEGMFVDGNAEGFGIYRFTDGRKYEGNHKNGKPYVVTFSNGDIFEGIFVDG